VYRDGCFLIAGSYEDWLRVLISFVLLWRKGTEMRILRLWAPHRRIDLAATEAVDCAVLKSPTGRASLYDLRLLGGDVYITVVLQTAN